MRQEDIRMCIVLLWAINCLTVHGRSAHSRPTGWSTWEIFSSCSVTCGIGSVKRTRVCIGSPEFCIGSKIDFKICDAGCCKVTADWCEWSEWSDCEYDCELDIGKQRRTRTCECPLAHDGGESCDGESYEEEECNESRVPCSDDADNYESHLPYPTPDEWYSDDTATSQLFGLASGDHNDTDFIFNLLDNPVKKGPIDETCLNFQEILKGDPTKADKCCKVMKTWSNALEENDRGAEDAPPEDLATFVSNNEINSEDYAADIESDDYHYDPLENNFEYAEEEENPPSLDDDAVSDLEECMSLDTSGPDEMLAARSISYNCVYARNRRSLRTICCVYRKCDDWKRDILKKRCRVCANEGLCAAMCPSGVLLSG